MMEKHMLGGMGGGSHSTKLAAVKKVREEFPETWLWSTISTG